MKRVGIILLILALVAAAALALRPRESEAAVGASLDALTLPPAEGFSLATEPNSIVFPDDLGPHDDYQTEWWYYTGNLDGPDGRPFGFQFTIFRRALAPPSGAPPSELETGFLERDDDSQSDASRNPVSGGPTWRSDQVYLAHFTISDMANDAFYPAERFSRGAAGLAGAQASPYRVWLEDWSVEEIAPGQVRLRAQTGEVALDLTLTETLPPVLHGDGGLSAKGPEPGNASYYYSIVQQRAEGTVTVPGETIPVTGLAWKDHEWSTSALSEGAIGWDWVSLQLDNGGALMLFEIRREDGTLEPTSAGSYITPDGQVQHLDLGDWTLEVTDEWTSPESGATYPAGWRISVPSVGLELTGEPQMAAQELNVSTVYWEGAVRFEGTLDGRPVAAEGYIEMTGYAGSMEGRL
jgi:predicted secreted hydrolase